MRAIPPAPRFGALLIWSRNTFWLVPAACVAMALALALVLPRLEDLIPSALLFPGGPEGARSVLGSIATSMISITGLVFSITIVALQLVAGQFTSRVMRDFLRDRLIQWTLGIFVATFTYALALQRSVRGTSETGAFVPALGVTAAFLLVLLSVGSFIAYIHHIANAIRIASIVDGIGGQTRKVIDDLFPDDEPAPVPAPPDGDPDHVVPAPRQGVVVAVDRAGLVEAARHLGVIVTVLAPIGEFRPAGAPVLAVHGETADRLDRRLSRTFSFDSERSHEQDVAFGFRQLVDIAERALSPSLNDPTTAVQALDQLHDLLRRIAGRPAPSGRHVDQDGALRVVLPLPAFPALLDLAVEEILHYGAKDPQTRRRVRAMLEDLCATARPEHRPAVRQWLTALPEP